MDHKTSESEEEKAEGDARQKLERLRWGEKVQCPLCSSINPIYPERRNNKPGFYRCPGSNQKLPHKPFVFSVRWGTLLARSNLPLHKWLTCLRRVLPQGMMHLPKPSGSSLARQLQITPLTARSVIKLIYSLDGHFLTRLSRDNNSTLWEKARHKVITSHENLFLMQYRVEQLLERYEGWQLLEGDCELQREINAYSSLLKEWSDGIGRPAKSRIIFNNKIHSK
tara:strand:+ start:3170 stop:3841 length:672 start_codon:yes stop_codon:yes gene_type:complete